MLGELGSVWADDANVARRIAVHGVAAFFVPVVFAAGHACKALVVSTTSCPLCMTRERFSVGTTRDGGMILVVICR